MTPTQPIPLSEPVSARSTLSAPKPRTPAPRVSVRAAVLLLVVGAVLVSGAAALGLNLWLGAAVWVAPLAAALGVVLAAVPLGLLGAKLARHAEAAQERAAASGTLSASSLTRQTFLELAGREWARSRRYGTGAALLLVEVDRFARLVEARGTAATDAVMAELLHQTAPTLRGADVLVRFSESQMAVFLAPADATGALDVAERIRERAEQLEVALPAVPQRLRFTVSVGVAHLRAAHLNLQSLLDDAEDAAQAARQAGGNCVRAAPVELVTMPASGNWLNNNDRARPK
jgi:diguanylate cyclase